MCFQLQSSISSDVCVHRKGHVIERSEQYVLNTLDGGKSMLTVKNIRQGDGGPYMCRASNKAGSSESQLFLKVFGEETFATFVHLIDFYKVFCCGVSEEVFPHECGTDDSSFLFSI